MKQKGKTTKQTTNSSTREEMLKAVIEKAVKNGWDKPNDFDFDYLVSRASMTKPESWFMYLFDHDFAKAFWGEHHICRWCGKSELETKLSDWETGEKITLCKGCGAEAMDYNEFPENGNMMFKWQYHLQQSVISVDPLLYYYERI